MCSAIVECSYMLTRPHMDLHTNVLGFFSVTFFFIFVNSTIFPCICIWKIALPGVYVYVYIQVFPVVDELKLNIYLSLTHS